jgi:hypothetical protein
MGTSGGIGIIVHANGHLDREGSGRGGFFVLGSQEGQAIA